MNERNNNTNKTNKSCHESLSSLVVSVPTQILLTFDAILRHLKFFAFAIKVACVASVSVRFRSKERGTRFKDRAKNGGSWLLFHFSRGQNRESRSSVFLCSETNGNACYAGYYLGENEVYK